MPNENEKDEIDFCRNYLNEIENCQQILLEFKHKCLEARMKYAELELKLCTTMDPSLIVAMKEAQTACENCIGQINETANAKEKKQDEVSS